MSKNNNNLDEISDEDLFKALEDALEDDKEFLENINNIEKINFTDKSDIDDTVKIDDKSGIYDIHKLEKINTYEEKIDGNNILNLEEEDDFNSSKKMIINKDDYEEIKNISDKKLENKKNNKTRTFINNLFNKIKDFLFKLKNNLYRIFFPKRIINIVAILICFIILFVSICGNSIMNYIKTVGLPKGEIFKSSGIIKIKQSFSGQNNGKFIFVSEYRSMPNEQIHLLKILIDRIGTIFYFDKNVDWNKYIITLIDDNDKNYLLDIDCNGNKDYLKFEPLSIGTKGIVLNIRDKCTNIEENFIFSIKGGVLLPKAVYINKSIDVIEDDTLNIKINRGVFSPSGTYLDYELDVKDNNYMTFGKIFLMEGSRVIPIKENSNYEYYLEDENKIIGTLELGALTSLEHSIKIKFVDVFINNIINKEIDVGKLFTNSLNNQIEFKVDKFVITLERLGLINNEYILVFHALDDEGNRVPIELDAELKCIKSSGDITKLKGICKSYSKGTDMIFNIGNEQGREFVNDENKFILDIKSVKSKKPNLITNIDLFNMETNKAKIDIDILNEVKNILQKGNYKNIKNITYIFEKDKFFGIYRINEGGSINEYLVKGIKNNKEWIFSKTFISSINNS